jgi:hypothetical protein
LSIVNDLPAKPPATARHTNAKASQGEGRDILWLDIKVGLALPSRQRFKNYARFYEPTLQRANSPKFNLTHP